MCVWYYYYLIFYLEYCGSRAIPSVRESPYLNYIGENLRPGIDIMWTGTVHVHKYMHSIPQLYRIAQVYVCTACLISLGQIFVMSLFAIGK